jgi:putative tricarboxylic transport membrane protein
MSDRIFAAAFLVVLAGLAWVGWRIEAPFSYEPIGPRAVPLLLLGAMAACCAWLLVKPDPHTDWPEDPRLRRSAAGVLVVVLGWSLAMIPLGFVASTALASLLIGRLFGAGWRASATAGVISAVAMYVFFDRILDVALPPGAIWKG